MRIVTLSDTHNLHNKITVPDGDLVIHAGDSTGRGTPHELEAFLVWFRDLPHRHKVLISGNHDFCFEESPRNPMRRQQAQWQGAVQGHGETIVIRSGIGRDFVKDIGGITYLQDEGTVIEGLKIWGSPWQPWFFDWAFNLRRGPDIADKWALIPDGTDVVVTHGPPAGILDRTDDGRSVGCEDLRDRIAVVKPKLHVFGHIHEGYGRELHDQTTYVNAAICTSAYRPTNSPIVVDL